MLSADEALVIELDAHAGLWKFTNIGVFFNSMDYLYRPVSYTPSRTAVDSDGKVRLGGEPAALHTRGSSATASPRRCLRIPRPSPPPSASRRCGRGSTEFGRVANSYGCRCHLGILASILYARSAAFVNDWACGPHATTSMITFAAA